MSVAAELFLQVEHDFAELKKQYSLFFNEQVKVEPYQLREDIMRRVKRLRSLSNLRTEDQFRTNNLISKVQSHLQLWDRQLENRYRGKGMHRPKRTATPPPAAREREPEHKSVVIGAPGGHRDKVVELYDEYMRLNLLLGARKMINFSKFESFIDNQTQKVQNTGSQNVRYEVLVQDQKVVIKSKSVK